MRIILLILFKKLHNPVSPATVARLGEKFLRGQELIPPSLQLTQQDQHQVFLSKFEAQKWPGNVRESGKHRILLFSHILENT